MTIPPSRVQQGQTFWPRGSDGETCYLAPGHEPPQWYLVDGAYDRLVAERAGGVSEVTLGPNTSYRCTKRLRECASDILSILLSEAAADGIQLSYTQLQRRLANRYGKTFIAVACQLLIRIDLLNPPRQRASTDRRFIWHIPPQVRETLRSISQARSQSYPGRDNAPWVGGNSPRRRSFAPCQVRDRPGDERSNGSLVPCPTRSTTQRWIEDSPPDTPSLMQANEGGERPPQNQLHVYESCSQDDEVLHRAAVHYQHVQPTPYICNMDVLFTRRPDNMHASNESESFYAEGITNQEQDSDSLDPAVVRMFCSTTWSPQVVEAIISSMGLMPEKLWQRRRVAEQCSLVYEQVQHLPPEEACRQLIITLEYMKTTQPFWKELRETAFKRWAELTEHALLRWNRRQSGMLFELVRQLAEEGEAFFCKEDAPYGFYLIQHAHFLRQEARWEEAKGELEQAVQLFEERGYATGLARALQELGDFYLHQGKLDDALSSYERALAVQLQVGNPAAFATACNSIGAIHLMRGEFKDALACFEQVMALGDQSEKTDIIAAAIHNTGAVYREQGKLGLALNYFEQALTLREHIGVPADIANSLNTIGGIYDVQGEPERALTYYEQALKLREQIGNPIDIATSLNNVGIIYKTQGKLERSLRCHERALLLREQIGNPIDIANSCNNIAHLYLERLGTTFLSGAHAAPLPEQEVMPAIESFKKALGLYEALGKGFEPEVAHELEALAFCFILSNNREQAVAYAKRARSIQEKIHQTAERRAISGNMSDFFTLVVYPLLDRLTEKHARQAFETARKSSRRQKRRQKRKR